MTTRAWVELWLVSSLWRQIGDKIDTHFVALETLLRFENCSSSHCLLSSWRRFHVFESSHPSFHRTVFFESLSAVFVASVPCLRVVASLVSSYRILRGTAVSFLCLRVVGSSFRRLRYIRQEGVINLGLGARGDIGE